MPQVASETTSHTFRSSQHNPMRSAQASEHAQGSPFESMLDDSTQAAAQQPNQSPPATQSDTSQPPVKANCEAKCDKPAKTGDTATASNVGKPAATGDDGKVTCDTAATVDTKSVALDATIAALSAAGNDGKPVGDGDKSASDGKPADGVTPADITAALPANLIQPTAPANAAAVPVTVVVLQTAPAPVTDAGSPAPVTDAGSQAPATDAGSQAALEAVLQASPAAAEHPAIIAAALPKARPAELATLKATSGKPAGDSNPPASTTPALQDDGKPQPVGADSGKDTTAHSRDDVLANTHHIASAEAPAAINTDITTAAPRAPGDAAQPIALTAPSHNASAISANQATAQPAAPLTPLPAAIPLAGVAIEIAAKALDGKNRFEIRLDPPELGRIEVRLDVDRDGNVTSRLIADRSDTLDLLRRDASGLERALQDAGLKTSDNGLQFSLRDQGMGREQSNIPTPGAAQLVVSDEMLTAPDITQRNYNRLAELRGGIDIRV